MSQLTARVIWVGAVHKMIGNEVNDFIEVGPGHVLSGLIKKNNDSVRVYNVSDLASLKKTLQVLS